MGLILWPQMIGEGTGWTRLGRVLFWTGAGIAGVILVVCLIGELIGGADVPGMAIIFGTLIAAPFYLAGRALCYIIANE